MYQQTAVQAPQYQQPYAAPPAPAAPQAASRPRRKAPLGLLVGVIIVAVAAVVLGALYLLGVFDQEDVVALEVTREPIPAATVEPVEAPPLVFETEGQSSNVYVEYILDASGSMAGQLADGTYKRDVAREVLIAHYRSFPSQAHVGLRAYGHNVDWKEDKDASCEDIELIAPVETGQGERITGWLEEFATLGMTPLSEAVQQAVDDFVIDNTRVNAIIMISDGQETCGGDPCQLVRDLKAEGIQFTLHVVGLDVDAATRDQLVCIADAGGGLYRDADNAAELSGALSDIHAAVVARAKEAPAVTITPEVPSEDETEEATEAPVVTEEAETPTPTPSPTPCLPDARFVSDVTVPDDTPFAAGAGFTKVWRVESNGCAAWPAGTAWTFVGGELLGAPAAITVPEIAPGGSTDISLEMRAPEAPGVYKSTWQMRGPDGAFFGDQAYVQIVVPQPVRITFVADRYTIKIGECATLSWLVENASAVQYNGQNVEYQGVRLECPVQTTRYVLRVQDLLGEWYEQTLTLEVEMRYY